MFDIGFWELLLISVITLIVVGPARLPEIASEIGSIISGMKRFINNARREIEQELDLRKDINYDKSLGDIDDLLKNAPDKSPDKTLDKSHKQ